MDLKGNFQQYDDNSKFQDQGCFDQAYMVLPLIPRVNSIYFPTDTVGISATRAQERLLFKLVQQSKYRKFGIVPFLQRVKTDVICHQNYKDKEDENSYNYQFNYEDQVGTLCEVVQFNSVPEKQVQFTNSKAVSRFRVVEMITQEPIALAIVEPYQDTKPTNFDELIKIASLEKRVWLQMYQYHYTNADVYDIDKREVDLCIVEVLRHCPDSYLNAQYKDLPVLDPDRTYDNELVISRMNLRNQIKNLDSRTKEYVFSEVDKTLTDCVRREKFSYAALRQIDSFFDTQLLLNMLRSQSPFQRLFTVYTHIQGNMKELIAEKAVKDLFA